MNGSKVPHSLRIVIFFLRLALGVNFLYLGIANLFDASIISSLHGQSFTSLYAWLGNDGPVTSTPHMLLAWASIVVGACLVLGLAARLAAIGGIILIVMGNLTAITAPTIYQLANVDLVAALGLLIILVSNAGAYIGLDAFIHIGAPKKNKER